MASAQFERNRTPNRDLTCYSDRSGCQDQLVPARKTLCLGALNQFRPRGEGFHCGSFFAANGSLGAESDCKSCIYLHRLGMYRIFARGFKTDDMV